MRLSTRYGAIVWCGTLVMLASCDDAVQRDPGQDVMPTSPRAVVMADHAPKNRPVVNLGDITPGIDASRRHRPWTAEERAALDALAASPEAHALFEVQRQVANRGPLALVLADHPLPVGVRSIIRLGAPPPLTRYFITTAEGLSDDVLDSSRGLAYKYEMRHPDDEGPVTLTLHRDGRFDRVSAKLGRETSGTYRRVGNVRTDDARTRAILAEAASITPQVIPGVGRARVYRFK